MKETVHDYVARGGDIEVVHYKTFEEVGAIPAAGGLRAVIQNARLLSYRGKLAGIASGASRRRRAMMFREIE